MAGNPGLAGHDRNRDGTELMPQMRVHVASDPPGVDVELHRADDPLAGQRLCQRTHREVVTSCPDQIATGRDAES